VGEVDLRSPVLPVWSEAGMSAPVSATPAPDRAAVRRAVEYCEYLRGQDGYPEDDHAALSEVYPVLKALADWWLAREAASDEEMDEVYRCLRAKILGLSFNNIWRACERYHAIAAPPADAGEKEDPMQQAWDAVEGKFNP
jgi:hypothetical protein